MDMIGGSGMEGFIFFWFFWVFWILSTFFMSKKDLRLKVSIGTLLVISLSLNKITWSHIEISLSGLFLLFLSYIMIAKQKGRSKSYLVIASFIMMLAYTTFHLYELFDPVWVIFNRDIMLSLLLAYLSVLLHSELHLRILTLICGAIHGDILYSLLIKKLSFSYFIGSFAFLDVISFGIAILLAISGFKRVSIYFEHHIKHLEREKQKQS
jgi:hypothetical protein